MERQVEKGRQKLPQAVDYQAGLDWLRAVSTAP
jgi:hypothetical protein